LKCKNKQYLFNNQIFFLDNLELLFIIMILHENWKNKKKKREEDWTMTKLSIPLQLIIWFFLFFFGLLKWYISVLKYLNMPFRDCVLCAYSLKYLYVRLMLAAKWHDLWLGREVPNFVGYIFYSKTFRNNCVVFLFGIIHFNFKI
jgi:hypothetical protein